MIVTILEDVRDEFISEKDLKKCIDDHNTDTIIDKYLVEYVKWLDNAEEVEDE